MSFGFKRLKEYLHSSIEPRNAYVTNTGGLSVIYIRIYFTSVHLSGQCLSAKQVSCGLWSTNRMEL